MTVGRFLAMAGALIWRRSDGRYLVLRRAGAKDVAAGEWEGVTGRLLIARAEIARNLSRMNCSCRIMPRAWSSERNLLSAHVQQGAGGRRSID